MVVGTCEQQRVQFFFTLDDFFGQCLSEGFGTYCIRTVATVCTHRRGNGSVISTCIQKRLRLNAAIKVIPEGQNKYRKIASPPQGYLPVKWDDEVSNASYFLNLVLKCWKIYIMRRTYAFRWESFSEKSDPATLSEWVMYPLLKRSSFVSSLAVWLNLQLYYVFL